MIYYFTGTGNSKYVAKQMSKILDEQLFSINDALKSNNLNATSQNKNVIFVIPTYAWRIPRVVKDYISKANFGDVENVYYVMTCGAESSNAIKYIEQDCAEKKWTLKGFVEVVMPDNYIAMFDTNDEATVTKKMADADTLIKEICAKISNKKSFVIKKKTSAVDKLKSSLVNDIFYPLFVNDKKYFATDKCVGCGMCENICPLKNITLKDGKPTWHNNCTQCMACISICPQRAIEYGNKTQKKGRYYLNVD